MYRMEFANTLVIKKKTKTQTNSSKLFFFFFNTAPNNPISPSHPHTHIPFYFIILNVRKIIVVDTNRNNDSNNILNVI